MVFRLPRNGAASRRPAGRPGAAAEPVNPYLTLYQRRNPRLLVLAGVVAGLLTLLAGGLFWRQVWPRGRYEISGLFAVLAGRQTWGEFAGQPRPAYDQRERQQVLRRVLQPGPRGEILDRKGRLLVGNQAKYSVVLYINEMRKEFNQEFDRLRRAWLTANRDDGVETRPTINSEELRRAARRNVAQGYLDQANHLLGRQDVLDEAAFEQHFRWNLLLPFPLLKDLSIEDYARFNAEMPVASPMQTYAEAARYYPYGSLAAHALGFVSRSDEQDDAVLQVEDVKVKTFALKGKVGRDGLERVQDETLRGTTGGEIWVVDPAGYLYRRTAQQTAQPGRALQTSLDLDLQRVAEAALDKNHHIGAVVALDVRTGEVLVMASKPDYDLNDTVPSIASAVNHDINARGAWLNRATKGLYPPGSTFKLVTAAAGLRAGLIDETTTVECPGFLKIGNRIFKCHNLAGHGVVDLKAALEESCNVFFYKAGMTIGPERIAAEARRFGLDQPTGINLAETLAMIVPDSAWKKQNQPEYGPWTAGDSAMLGIGQSFLRVTPLQMACLAASLARDETRTVPTLLYSPDRDPAAVNAGGQRLNLPPEDRQLLLDGMERAVLSGTGHPAKIPGVRIAAKTGTAQVMSNKVELTLAWFVGFAPVENPRIAIAVAIEGDDPNDNFHGGLTAGPIARAVLEEYFKQYPSASAPAAPVASSR